MDKIAYLRGITDTSLIVAVLFLVGYWKIYTKLGREGWESLVPFYSQYILFEELYGNGWKFLTLLIPIYNIYMICKYNIDLAHHLGRSTGFGWGMILMPYVFIPILGLSKD